MALTFYYASGSPYAWRVWLALEHKRLTYERKTLSFSAGDLKSPEYLALNPRGRVPTLSDDAFVLWESAAIVEYLDQAWPDSGDPLFPRDPRGAALVRRMVLEVDNYFQPPMERLVEQVLETPQGERRPAVVAAASNALLDELERWGGVIHDGGFLAGPVSAADFALYPQLALVLRMEKRHSPVAVSGAIGPAIRRWQARVEALPYFAGTYPPHWR